MVTAVEYDGLVGPLADLPADLPHPDAARLAQVVEHPWGMATVEATVHASSARQAARLAAVHHSTLQARLKVLVRLLGFDPFDGFDHAQLTTAYLV